MYEWCDNNLCHSVACGDGDPYGFSPRQASSLPTASCYGVFNDLAKYFLPKSESLLHTFSPKFHL